jgi:hypothetical protein
LSNEVPALVEELRQAAMIQETWGDMGRRPGSTLVVYKRIWMQDKNWEFCIISTIGSQACNISDGIGPYCTAHVSTNLLQCQR